MGELGGGVGWGSWVEVGSWVGELGGGWELGGGVGWRLGVGWGSWVEVGSWVGELGGGVGWGSAKTATHIIAPIG